MIEKGDVGGSVSGQTRGPDGRLLAVDEARHIRPFEPVTAEALELAGRPWSPGPDDVDVCLGCGRPFAARLGRCPRCG